ncbi:MAG: PAS domain S-box protein [bacterium]
MPKKTSIQKRRKTVPGSKSQETRKTSSSAQTTRPAAKAKSKKSAPTDTTRQQKKMADAYQVSENHVRLIIDNLPVLISYVDKDLRYRFNNNAYSEWFGLPRESLHGKHVKEVLGDKGYEKVQARIEAALSGQKVSYEMAIPYKNGKKRFVHAQYLPDIGEQGQVKGFFVLVEDIAKRKEAEKLLKKSQAETASIIKNAVDPLITIDELGMIEVFNPAAARTFGYSASEVIGKNVKMLMPEHYHSEHDGYLDNYNKTGEAKVIGIGREVVGQRKDGSVFPMDLAINEMEVGGERRFVGICRDITERKGAEDLLKESEKKFRQLAENIEEVFWMEDKEGEEIIYISPAFEKVWGLKCEDLIKNPQLWMESIHPEDREKVENAYSYEDRTPAIEGKYKSEFRIIRPDGTVCWISDRAFPVLNEEGNPIRIAGISQDITELKLIEQELQEAKETLELRVQERTMELRQRNRQLKNLLAHLENVREEERVHIAREVHDELGQILTAFKFDLSELEELIPPDSKGIGNLVKKLIKDADTTLESVQRILTRLRPQVLDIFGVGPAFEWQANEFQNQTGITCEVNHFPENLQIEKDKSLILFRILQEALWNVKHHAQASQVQINFRVNDENLIMEIKDNGVGMKPENVNDPQSFGILGIQERADLLGGTASFRSNPGEGTTVSIRLPK